MEHKVITGGEQWLPFARSRIKALQATGLAYASQKFEVEGALVEVRIEPGHEYIRIMGGAQAVYEFFTTGPEINPNAGSGGASADRLNNPGSAVRVVLRDKTLFAIPLWSSIYDDTEQPGDKRWAYVDRRWWSQNHVRVSGPAYGDNWVTVFSHPSEHFGSHHHYTAKNELITSCRAWGPGASTLPTYEVGRKFNYSRAIWGANGNVNYSFGMVLDYLVPTTRDPAKAYYDQDYGDSGSGNSFQLNGCDFPFAWTDLRRVKAPLYEIEAGPPVLTSFTPPVGFYRKATYGYSIAVSDAVRGMRRQPESARESDKPNTFDIPPAYYTKDYVLVGAGKVNPNVHWRTAAIHEATGPDGRKIKVVVLTDTHNGFMFYEARNWVQELPSPPAGELDGWIDATSYRNIPEAKRVRVKPAMPSWVTLPDESAAYDEKTWLWRFDKNATRAVSTPVRSVQKTVWIKPEYPYESGFMVVNMALDKPTAALSDSGWVEAPLYSIPNLSDEVASPLQGRLETIKNECEAQGRSYHVHIGGGFGTYFFELAGKLHPFWGFVIWIDEDGFDDIVREHVVPVKDVTPGLVEVSIAVAVEYGSDGSVALNPTVEVVRSDHYTISGKMYADAAYFVNSGRGVGGSSLKVLNAPNDDDLLVADIHMSSRVIPAKGVETFVHYRVNNAAQGVVVTSLCLAAGVDAQRLWNHPNLVRPVWGDVGPNPYQDSSGPFGAFFVGIILAQDLRYLAFLTASYHRRNCKRSELIAAEPGGLAFAHPHNISPRIELRVAGLNRRFVVNYSKAVYDGDYPLNADDLLSKWYGPKNFGVDPMINIGIDYQPQDAFSELQEGIVEDVSGTPVTTPEYRAAMYQGFLSLVTPAQYYMTFAFSPKGDFAVYFDARTSQFAPTGNTTETSGVIDVIKIGDVYTSHKKAFNAAFRKNFDYSIFPVDNEPSPSGRFGMNGIFIYNAPPSSLTNQPVIKN